MMMQYDDKSHIYTHRDIPSNCKWRVDGHNYLPALNDDGSALLLISRGDTGRTIHQRFFKAIKMYKKSHRFHKDYIHLKANIIYENNIYTYIEK